MANHMAEVAKMLGVELGERFDVLNSCDHNCGTFYLTEKGVMNDKSGYYEGPGMLLNLIYGYCTIKRKPWKPKRGETYWYVEKDGDIWEMEWHPCRYMSDHVNRYKLGNCYRTREEAEADRDKWVAFYASDEVLEV